MDRRNGFILARDHRQVELQGRPVHDVSADPVTPRAGRDHESTRSGFNPPGVLTCERARLLPADP